MAAISDAGSDGRSPLSRLGSVISRERTEVLQIFGYAAIAGALGLAVPLGVQALVGIIAGGLLLQPVILLIGFVVLATLLAGVVQVLQLAVAERLQQRIFARLAFTAAERLGRADTERLSATNLPELTNRFFEVINLQKSLAKLLTDAVTAVLAIAAGLVLLTVYNPFLSLFGFTLLCALTILLLVTGRSGLASSIAESASKYRVAHWLQELARHATMLRLVAPSALPIDRVDQVVDEYLVNRQTHFRVLVMQASSVVIAKTLITGGLLVIGTMLVINRQISLGQFVASELVIVTLLAGVEKFILSLEAAYDALTAVDKMAHLEELPIIPSARHDAPPLRPREVGRQVAHPMPALRGDRGAELIVQNVGYRYAQRTASALRDISFRIAPGERVAIEGSEGAGASTLLHVIAGLLRNFDGGVAVDGLSIRDADSEAWNDVLALAGPGVHFIEGTIVDNIVMGRARVTMEDVRWAIELVGLTEFVRELSSGVETRVGGVNSVPSNAARKIVLARAIVTRPRLLLIDEFFHALSPDDRTDLFGRLLARDVGWTIVAATHVPEFYERADQHIWLADGKVHMARDRAQLHASPDTLLREGSNADG